MSGYKLTTPRVDDGMISWRLQWVQLGCGHKIWVGFQKNDTSSTLFWLYLRVNSKKVFDRSVCNVLTGWSWLGVGVGPDHDGDSITFVKNFFYHCGSNKGTCQNFANRSRNCRVGCLTTNRSVFVLVRITIFHLLLNGIFVTHYRIKKLLKGRIRCRGPRHLIPHSNNSNNGGCLWFVSVRCRDETSRHSSSLRCPEPSRHLAAPVVHMTPFLAHMYQVSVSTTSASGPYVSGPDHYCQWSCQACVMQSVSQTLDVLWSLPRSARAWRLDKALEEDFA